MSEIIGRRIRTEAGAKLGKLKDFVVKDDPKYAEVTHLIAGRPYGDPSLKVPWSQVIEVGPKEIMVQNPRNNDYTEVGPDEDLLLLRDKILDKRVLDTEGFAVEVVYDIQLLLVESKLFIVAADVSRRALARRLGFGRLGGGLPKDAGLEGFIPWKYVQPLGTDLTATKGDVRLTIAKNRLGEIHPEDLADILEELNHEERIHVFSVLDSRAAAATLGATEPRVQREILASASAERVAQIFTHLSAVEIAEVISILPKEDAEEIQKTLGGSLGERVHELITQHDVPASVLAVRRFLQFPGSLTVEDTFTRFRKEAPNSLVTMYVYVVDDEQRLKGVVDINELLQANPDSRLEEIMTKSIITIAPTTMRGEVEALFRRYRFRAIPVVDEGRKIVGVVKEKDAFSTGDEVRLSR
ncbi:MAG: CBS domain-containing protein [Nitrososphaerales archaeon]